MRCILPLILAVAVPSLAADIEVSGAKVQSYPVALAPAVSTEAKLRSRGQDVLKRVDALLRLTGMIKVLDPASFLAKVDEGLDPKKIQFEAWRSVGAGPSKQCRAQKAVVIEYIVFDVTSAKPLANGSCRPVKSALRMSPDRCWRGLTRSDRRAGPVRSQLAF